MRLKLMATVLTTALLALLLVAGCESVKRTPSAETLPFMNGADISVTPQLEDHGVVYSDDQGEADIFTILDRHGFNSIRLKIWHTPREAYNDLAHVKAMAQRIHAHDMYFMLDFHYSDWWADPQKQYKPAAWEELSFDLLQDSLYAYSRDVVHALDAQGTPPKLVQIGNEIRPGMLWPDGRVDGDFDTPAQWDNLAALLERARQGVLDGLTNPEGIEIVVHFDNGGNNTDCRKFYDSLEVRGVEFDIIGLSFYPKWHGTLDSLETNLADLSSRYSKDVMVVESAYPFTMGWNDDQGNIWGMEEDLHEGYAPTIEGQVAYFTELRRIVTSVPNGRGKGLYYWEPGMVSVEGVNSPWENVCLFDFDGKALPAMDAFTGQNGENH